MKEANKPAIKEKKWLKSIKSSVEDTQKNGNHDILLMGWIITFFFSSIWATDASKLIPFFLIMFGLIYFSFSLSVISNFCRNKKIADQQNPH